jgi:hypothetical protein
MLRYFMELIATTQMVKVDGMASAHSDRTTFGLAREGPAATETAASVNNDTG